MNNKFLPDEVTPVKEKMTKERMLASTIVGIIVIILFFTVASGFYQVIEPSHMGLVIKGGELQDDIKNNGFYLKLPFWTQIVPVFVGTLSTDEDKNGKFKEENPFRNIQPLSKDGQVLDIDVQINYSIIDAKKFREKTGNTDPRVIEQLFFVPTVRTLVYDYASEYGWKSLIQEGNRQEFGQRIFRSMTSGETTKRICKEEKKEIDKISGTEIVIAAGCELVPQPMKIASPSDYGIAISGVNFKKIQPNQSIIAAVEQAQAKEQEVKIAAQEASIAVEQANKKIEEKRGETESIKLEADAAAYRLRVEKEEEAKGILALAEAERARASALAASQQLVEYKKLEIEMKKAEALVAFGENWTGDVPSELNIIGTEEAKNMQLFWGMGGIVANPQ